MTDKLKVKFHPVNDFVSASVPSPKPARFYIPEWFKEIPMMNGQEKTYTNGKLQNMSPKLCMPFSDSFTTGYIQETWTEIHIGVDQNGDMKYNYASAPEIISAREPRTFIPENCYPHEFTWRMPWMPQVPNGWSVLITHPLNQTQLPFHTMSGILESDSYYRSSFPNNLPFLVDKGFKGIIPVGTPMFQIIPFQRQEWKHEICQYDEYAHLSDLAKVLKYFSNGYKLAHWKRKVFV